MHFSYISPPSPGKISSWLRMIVLITSLTLVWKVTWSRSGGIGISVGPKQIARLYGSIMFSSEYSDKLPRKQEPSSYQRIKNMCVFWVTQLFLEKDSHSLVFWRLQDFFHPFLDRNSNSSYIQIKKKMYPYKSLHLNNIYHWQFGYY